VFETAVAGLVRRVDGTLAESEGRFPVYADPESGAWTWTDDGGWTGGFWAGLLWLTATATGDDRYAQAAAGAAGRLRPQLTTATMLRGFLFWYGAGPGPALGPGRDEQAGLAEAAARELSRTFDPVAGVLPPGAADADQYRWPSQGACADGMPGGVPLLAVTAELAGPATRVADWYLDHAPDDLICYWDFGDPAIPDAPRDTSAAAIAAAALAKLAPVTGEAGPRYRAAAERILGTLAAVHAGPRGGLGDGCYSHRQHLAERHELIWGDYFALEAMLAVDGLVDPGEL